MNKFFGIILFCTAACLITSCSQVLQTVDLKISAEDNSLQEEFNVIEKTLTIIEAKKQNGAQYERRVIQHGRGSDARLISENLALKSNFPKNQGVPNYKIGIGDTLTFSRLIDNNKLLATTDKKWPTKSRSSKYKLGIGDTLALTLIRDEKTFNQLAPNGSTSGQSLIISSQQNDITINSTGRIGSDGSVLLLEVGRLEAVGKSLNELRSEVRNILIRNGVSPRFQLEIVEFKSQRAYLTTYSSPNGKGLSKIIILDDQKTTLVDILASAEFGVVPGIITRVKLQRGGKNYYLSLRQIFNENAPEITISDRDHIFVEDSSAIIVSTSSTVDHEGSVVFEPIGKLKVDGLSLDELRDKIEKLIQKVPDSQNAFQINITDFASQTALLSIRGKPGIVAKITDKPVMLAQLLTQNGLTIDGNNITRINLKRSGNNYVFNLDDLLNQKTAKVYLKPDDHITVDMLSYKENKVFILGGGVSPQIFKISPANRETLADVLFTSGGALSASSAQRSEVYLLRGSSPVIAFHLDAQSPTRLIVADAMELRPNDILYVAEQPIISFNRALATIVPLRILLRDIQDENIP